MWEKISLGLRVTALNIKINADKGKTASIPWFNNFLNILYIGKLNRLTQDGYKKRHTFKSVMFTWHNFEEITFERLVAGWLSNPVQIRSLSLRLDVFLRR